MESPTSEPDADSIRKAFGKRLRELRKALGVSQEELALLSDLDRSYVGQTERGERNIALENIHRLACGLGVQASELLVRAGEKHSVRRRE